MPDGYIPIEIDRELLAEYGSAFAWFNLVEDSLGEVIYFRGRLSKIDPKLADKLIGGKTLGAKIQLASIYIEPKTIEKLKKLNTYRIELSHGVVSETVDLGNPNQRTRNYFLTHKNKDIPLTHDRLSEAISLAKELSEFLMLEIKGEQHC